MVLVWGGVVGWVGVMVMGGVGWRSAGEGLVKVLIGSEPSQTHSQPSSLSTSPHKTYTSNIYKPHLWLEDLVSVCGDQPVALLETAGGGEGEGGSG